MPDDLNTIATAHDRWIVALIAKFQNELNGIVAAAQARTLAQLQERLATKNGKIVRSAANSRVLRRFDAIFLEELDRAGYQHLLNELVDQFPGQLQFFRSALDAVSAGMRTPLPDIGFSPRDLQVFADQGLSVKDGLDAVMESVANRAKQRILLSVGGLSFPDLAEALASYLHKALPEAVGLAETATATYYRIVADRGFQLIEADLPSFVIRYRYFGPFDKLTRPFCRHLLEVGKSYTREEIDAMDNGQIPNVFVSAGGFRCRHTWLISGDSGVNG